MHLCRSTLVRWLCSTPLRDPSSAKSGNCCFDSFGSRFWNSCESCRTQSQSKCTGSSARHGIVLISVLRGFLRGASLPALVVPPCRGKWSSDLDAQIVLIHCASCRVHACDWSYKTLLLLGKGLCAFYALQSPQLRTYCIYRGFCIIYNHRFINWLWRFNGLSSHNSHKLLQFCSQNWELCCGIGRSHCSSACFGMVNNWKESDGWIASTVSCATQ